MFAEERHATVLQLRTEDATIGIEYVELLAVDVYPPRTVGQKAAAQRTGELCKSTD
jgi:hypothetical protein